MVGFPWTVGDTTLEGMKGLAEKFKDSEVSPLTGFDSGMILYHKSIIDFFIPYTPRGEGGFNGHWSLCAHFLTLFGPNLFHGAAIRVNALPYTNLISFDNVPEDERKPTKVSKNGLILHAESRHPYEYHMNAPFRTFLSNGMINRQQRWGRDMTEYDVLWRVEIPDDPLTLQSLQKDPLIHKTINKWTILKRLTNFYDISHPIVSQNKWLRQQFTDPELTQYLQNRSSNGLDFSFVIHIFTLNRKESFDKLWTSINQANQIRHPVSFHIHLDTLESDNNAPFFFYIQHLQSLVSNHGKITVSVNSKHKGLKQSIMDAWTPADSREYGIFLEDDVSVSPHFLEFAEQMVERYLSPRGGVGYSSKCIGVSLYNQRYDEVNERDWTISTTPNYTPYILQQPQSWGAVYSPDAWNDFRKWFLAQPPSLDPFIPNSLTNRWLKSKSWKKYLIRYMYAKGKFMIYPNFPGGLSFTTNRLEVGTNDKVSGGAQRKLMLQRFNVPLLDLERVQESSVGEEGLKYLEKVSVKKDGRVRLDLTSSFLLDSRKDVEVMEVGLEIIKPLLPGALIRKSSHLSPMNKLDIYNVHFKKVNQVGDLLNGITPKSFDKCTLILEASSASALVSTLQHYHLFVHLDSILVVWNSKDHPPVLKAPKRNAKKTRKKIQYDYKVPIDVIKPSVYSPNNLFKAYSHIGTDCIIVSDTKLWVVHDQLNFAVSLFQGHFFNNLIGFSRAGHSHSRAGRKWEYIGANNGPISFLEVSGVVFHRKYLELYSSSFYAIGRKIVEDVGECGGVLLNMLIARETRKGPVIINTYGNSSLEISSEVAATRSGCFNEFFEKVFDGKMNMKYTTSKFQAPKPTLKRSMKVIEYPDEASPSFKQH
ncbi:UNVERIFIED_CONTAM: hypothetical protein HDU68_012451, partial [Siphonaria sp. JEL0065]